MKRRSSIAVFGLTVAMMLGRAFGDTLYVSDNGSGTITEINSAGVANIFATVGSNSVQGIALDASGNVYVAGEGSSTIYKVSPNGVVNNYASVPGVLTGIAFDSNGNLYATGSGIVSEVTPGGVVNPVISGLSNPQGLTVDAQNNLYVATNTGSDTEILEITPTGSESTFATIPFVDGINSTIGLAFDNGNLYAAVDSASNAGEIDEFNPSGAESVFATLPINPNGIAFDSDGNLFAAGGNNDVYEISPSGTVAATPYSYPDSDGYSALWVAVESSPVAVPLPSPFLGSGLLFAGLIAARLLISRRPLWLDS